MAEGPDGATQVRVICETDQGHVELRVYDSDGSTAPSWWIGQFDSAGALNRSWISNGADLTLRDLQRWLRPIVGYEVAGRLARTALHVHAEPMQDRRLVKIAPSSGLVAVRAS